MTTNSEICYTVKEQVVCGLIKYMAEIKALKNHKYLQPNVCGY